MLCRGVSRECPNSAGGQCETGQGMIGTFVHSFSAGPKKKVACLFVKLGIYIL